MKRFKISDILIGIIFTFFFLSLGIVSVINFRPLYYMDVNLLHIAETSGYSKDVIIENYNALIDYCSPFFHGELSFPSLASSTNGSIHFAEVKDIFVFFYYILLFTTILVAIIIIYKQKRKNYSYLFVSSIVCIVLPIIVGGLCAISFDKTFILFHKLFFDNDYWMFDPYLDPVINILPEAFFLHCAIFIILFILIGSFILWFVSYRIKRKRSLSQRKMTGLNI